MEKLILEASDPVEFDQNVVQEITLNGEHGLWLNKSEVDNLLSQTDISDRINKDPYPQIIRKKPTKTYEQKQVVKVSYLRPPTPPHQGEIIIQKEPNKITPAAPPLIIRQIPEAPKEKLNPLVVREAPPIRQQDMKQIEPQIITIPGKILPPPPRKVIINREYYYINSECSDKKKSLHTLSKEVTNGKYHKVNDLRAGVKTKPLNRQPIVSIESSKIAIQSAGQQASNGSNGYFYTSNNANSTFYTYSQPTRNYSAYYRNY